MAAAPPTLDADFGRKHINPGVSVSTGAVAVSGQGVWLTMSDGRRLLDFTAGIAVTSTGHSHPKVVKAVQEQAGKLLHGQCSIVYHEPMLQLIHRLQAYVPPQLDSYFFTNSGAEAIENAIKLARQASGKPNIIVFQGSYHGRTIGTLSLTTSKTIYRSGFGPLMPGVFVAPFPYAKQLPSAIADDEDAQIAYCLEQLELLLHQQTSPNETAAILLETVLGEGGYVAAPVAFLQGLRAICDASNILLVFDEVQAGFGRTGRMFAFEHSGVHPDILVVAKGIASGMPLSAVIASGKLTARQPAGSMGGTYSGNVLACAAAVATLDVFEEENLVENSRKRGEQLVHGLRALQAKGYPIYEIRGQGLMVGLEFNDSCEHGTASRVTKAALAEGLMLLSCSAFEVIRFVPALVVSSDEITDALRRFEAALAKAFPTVAASAARS